MHKAMIFNNFEIFSVRGNDYRVHSWNMSKDKAINVFKKNANLTEKSWTL